MVHTMPLPHGRRIAAFVLVVLAIGWVSAIDPVLSAPSPSRGTVRGAIIGPEHGVSVMWMRWFTRDWRYLGTRTVRNGLYSIRLSPGSYRLQFVDTLPSYDVRRLAPADVRVIVRSGHTTVKNVRMRRGAAITGSVRTHAGRSGSARLIAVSRGGQVFGTVANSRGQFAIGGLPAGSYSVYSYDRSRTWVGKSVWVPHLGSARARNIVVRLATRAGRLLLDLYGGGEVIRARMTVTVVSTRTGQFWTVTSHRGTASFSGLYPGRYRVTTGASHRYLPVTGRSMRAKVRAGGASFGSIHLTRRPTEFGETGPIA